MLNHPRYKALGHFPTSPRNSRIKTALPRDETELHGVFVKPCVRCHPTAPARSIGVQRRPIACTYGALRRRSAIRFCVQPRAKSASRQRMHGSLPRGAGRLWVACSLFLRCISHEPVSERLVLSTFVRPVSPRRSSSKHNKSPTQRAGLKSGLPIEGVFAKYHDLSIPLVFLQFNVNFFLPVRASKKYRCRTTGCPPGLIGHPVFIRSSSRSISMLLGPWPRQ